MHKNNISQTIESESGRAVRSFRLSRIILPVLLGVAAVAYLFYGQFDSRQFREIQWTGRTFAWIGLAFVVLLLRHLFYTLRLHTITGSVFSWRKCLKLIVFWEFSAALTPTSKGGPFVMLFVLTRENLSAGRTAAAIFYTMALDSAFFIISLPLLLSVYGPPMLYPGMKRFGDVGLASGTFFVTYGLMAAYLLVLVFFC
ncbi:MAG: flippase-like domain-containing protein [Lewinellaceae bacterium]|nr:flippase-like domain-containing protein [Lewinellaceae bacterium]